MVATTPIPSSRFIRRLVFDHALSFGDPNALDAQHCRQSDSTADHDHDHDAHVGNGTALQEESCVMLCAMVRLRS